MKLEWNVWWILPVMVILMESIHADIVGQKTGRNQENHRLAVSWPGGRRVRRMEQQNLPCSQMCMNGGTCYMMENDIKCLCSPGFVGKYCEEIKVDLECKDDYMRIKVPKIALVALNTTSFSLHTANPQCSMQDLSDLYLNIVLTPANHTFCGTTLQVNGSHLIYSNYLTTETNAANLPVPGDLITRSSALSIHLSCVYPYDGIVSLHYPLLTNYTLVTFAVKEGIFKVTMALYPTSKFIQPYKWIPVIQLYHNLFVQLQVHNHDPKSYFSLRVEDCWATPTANDEEQMKHPIITSGYPKDTTVEMIETFDNSLTRFSLQMFQFVRYKEIYLHCKIWLCPSNATVFCNKPDPYTGRKKRDVENPYTNIISFGPIMLTSQTVSGVGRTNSGMGTLVLPGSLAVGAIFVLLCLVAVAKVLKRRELTNRPYAFTVYPSP